MLCTVVGYNVKQQQIDRTSHRRSYHRRSWASSLTKCDVNSAGFIQTRHTGQSTWPPTAFDPHRPANKSFRHYTRRAATNSISASNSIFVVCACEVYQSWWECEHQTQQDGAVKRRKRTKWITIATEQRSIDSLREKQRSAVVALGRNSRRINWRTAKRARENEWNDFSWTDLLQVSLPVIVMLRLESNQFVTATVATSNERRGRRSALLHPSPSLLTFSVALGFSGYVNLIASENATHLPTALTEIASHAGYDFNSDDNTSNRSQVIGFADGRDRVNAKSLPFSAHTDDTVYRRSKPSPSVIRSDVNCHTPNCRLWTERPCNKHYHNCFIINENCDSYLHYARFLLASYLLSLNSKLYLCRQLWQNLTAHMLCIIMLTIWFDIGIRIFGVLLLDHCRLT